MQRFTGMTAIVTGATTGIGQAIAVCLASEGAQVTVAHKPGQPAQETLDAVASTSPDEIWDEIHETSRPTSRVPSRSCAATMRST